MRLRSIAVFASAALLVAVATLGADEPSPTAARPSNPFGRVYPPRIYNTVTLQGPAPVIDGRLDDPAWSEGEWAGDYRQYMPTEGAAPSQRTELKILYDETNVYVAIRAYDEMDKVHRYAGRRDSMVGDVVGVCFDSYFDKRTGFEFDITAAGSKIDLILMNDGEDTSWDAVWDGATARDAGAWTAEFRIPLSQLRYGPADEQVWGLHAWRWIDRNQEEDQWNLIPRNSSGRMYNLGELHGIRGIKRFRHVELLPYTLGRLVADPRVAGDPYRSGAATFGSAGLDAKIGLTTDITLDATVNPDFGQVEADPSVMNLTAYETFYEEKRPFFLEGRNILAFKGASGGQLFYSRRIGHAPGHSPTLGDDEFMRLPDQTSILGALKVTGKTRSGLSLGVVQSLTGAETAAISSQGRERRERVEPTANYFVARVQKDWDKGNTSLGGIVTSTHRWIQDEALRFMARDAFTGGLDFTRYFKSRSYSVGAKLIFGRVSGDARAMQALQANAVHYYQRPDAGHLTFKPDAESLAGHAGRVNVARQGTSKWRFSETFQWVSPGLELNDLGYLQRADLMTNDVSVTYKETRPRGILRDYGAYFARVDTWDYSGLRLEANTTVNAYVTYKNKWGTQIGGTLVQEPLDTRLLRGGPAIKLSRFLCTWVYGRTNTASQAWLAVNVHNHIYPGERAGLLQVTPEANLRLSTALSLAANVDYARRSDGLQYVSTVALDGQSRQILGKIRQQTLNATLRVNLQLAPELSVQYYGSPFVSTGRYSDFKRVDAPRADVYDQRFQRFRAEDVAYRADVGRYDVIEAGGAARYSFRNPNFSFRQFRSNVVLRWEYKPGSALYAVWSQGRTSSEAAWESSLSRNYSALLKADAQNVFLVKFSHWFSM